MNNKKRGKAYVFNHENFNPGLELKPRMGTAKDRDNLYMRLRELDFEVKYFDDLTFFELTNKIVSCKYVYELFAFQFKKDCFASGV